MSKHTINAEEVIIGHNVVIEDDVLITGKGSKAKRVVLGDNCYIGHGTRIIVPSFEIGDYSKLHAYSFVHGKEPMSIGRNCWIGGNTVLDSMGGLTIDDNVGIGASSQLWTHIQFGDIVEGSRFFQYTSMHIGKDAWFVGHCVVSPVKVEEKSMALVGSVVTKDMLYNRIYGGSPAKDLTDKMGHQFEDRTIEQKAKKLNGLIEEFYGIFPQYKGAIKVITSDEEIDEDRCCFNVSNRTYNKRLDQAEVAFLKHYVPIVKFIPRG